MCPDLLDFKSTDFFRSCSPDTQKMYPELIMDTVAILNHVFKWFVWRQCQSCCYWGCNSILVSVLSCIIFCHWNLLIDLEGISLKKSCAFAFNFHLYNSLHIKVISGICILNVVYHYLCVLTTQIMRKNYQGRYQNEWIH